MIFTREQIRTAYKNLPSEVQNFIMDSETTDLIGETIGRAKFSEEESDVVDSQILYALYGLQSLPEAIENIANISGRSISDLSGLRDELKKNIFDKIPGAVLPEKNIPQVTISINDRNSLKTQSIEQTLNNYQNSVLSSVIDSLFPELRQIILNAEWRKRVEQVGTKYSLTAEQINSLTYETLFIIIGMEAEADFVANVESNVGVSRLVAGQLVEEIGSRVFDWIDRSVQPKENKIEEKVKIPQNSENDQNNENIKRNTQPGKVAVPNYSGLLNDIEKMADIPSDHVAKVAPPPPNLPGMEESMVPSQNAVPENKQEQPMEKVIEKPIAPKPSTITEQKLGSTYQGSDPYREPIN